MKLKIKSSCVFHGDRAAGEILEFDTLPPDAAIVIGAGLAEILTDEPDEPEPEQPDALPPLDALEQQDADSAEVEAEPEPVKPAKRSAKRKR